MAAVVADAASGQVLFAERQLAGRAGVDREAGHRDRGARRARSRRTVHHPGCRGHRSRGGRQRPASIVLVGGGDPTLTAGRAPARSYPRPASLQALAAAAARALAGQHRRSVRIGYDTSLYSGPGLAPGWTESYLTTGNVTAITPLEVDQGRLLPDGRPEDADDPGNLRPRSLTPAADAAGGSPPSWAGTASG